MNYSKLDKFYLNTLETFQSNPENILTELVPDIHTVHDFLQNLAPDSLKLDNLKLSWIKNKPGGDLRLLYTARHKEPYFFFARRLPFYKGKQYAMRMNQIFARAIQRHERLKEFGRAAIYSTDLGFLFEFYPADRCLSTLIQTTDPEFMKLVLQQTLTQKTNGKKLHEVTINSVQYKPERKCLLRYQLEWKNPDSKQLYYGKIFHKVRQVFVKKIRIFQHWQNSVFKIPEPVALLPGLNMELLSSIPGTHLSRLCTQDNFPDICSRIASGLLEFQKTPVTLPDMRRISEEISQLKSWGNEFALFWPQQAPLIHRLVDRLTGNLLQRWPSLPTPVHGDFHVANILVDDNQLGLIDFENCFMGPPAIDVGSFYAQLKLLSLKTCKQHTALDESVHAFLDTYQTHCEPDARSMLPTYCALSCLWCAYYQCLLRPVKPGWLERAHIMLELSERILQTGEL
ncbi:MAG: aminoglycoside phosphotransferase family protein [Calditrichaeota bacterium]|nr:MAG: aminoglycoside phosphotransferase family protein [Calditrichota bacterium]